MPWKWNITAIAALQYADNVIDLMSRKLAGYPDETRAVLGIAACIGNTFEMETLEAASEKNISELLPLLASPLEDNVIILKETAAFTHDRLQEAAYRLLDETNLADIHYKTGKFLYSRYYDSDDTGKYLFRIADHLNAAVEIITEPLERQILAEINLQAGKKAMKSVAYKSALIYLKAGIDLLPEDCFESMYEVAFDLHLESAEAIHMNGETEKAIAGLDELENRAKGRYDVTRVAISKTKMFTITGDYKKATKNTLDCLRYYNVYINKSKFQFLSMYIKTRLFLYFNKKKFFKFPVIEEKNDLILIELIYSLGYSAWEYSATLFSKFVMHILIKKRLHKYSSAFFGNFSIVLMRLMKYSQAYSIASAGIALNKKMNSVESRATLFSSTAGIVYPWFVHLKKCIALCNESYLCYYITGERFWPAWGCVYKIFFRILSGEPLNEIEKEGHSYYNFIKGNRGLEFFLIVSLQLIRNLKGLTKSIDSWDDNLFSEKKIQKEINIIKTFFGVQFIYHIGKLFTSIIYRQYSTANHISLKTNRLFKKHFYYLLVYPLYIFFYTISILKTNPDLGGLRLCRRHIRLMKLWAFNCPDNFLQFYLLMQAEYSRITGRKRKDEIGNKQSAEVLYQRAIDTSEKFEYINFQAIACELAADYFYEKKITTPADAYIIEVYRLFEKWGASAKCVQLKEKYPDLFAAVPAAGNVFNSIDMMSIMKVSQSLSGDIELESLIKKISRYVIENAGADKGALILIDPAGGRLEVKAVIKAGSDADILDGVYIDNRADLPESLIRYVERTKEIYISGGTGAPSFSGDRYLASKKPQSVLCAPIINQGRLTGIMYLENSLARDAFTSGRVEILNMLISQAAVSIENARLYADMEQRVAERTAVIEKQKEAYERDIQLARRIQLSLLPDQLPRAGGSLLAFKYVPMMGVGGDFLDIIYQSEDRRLLGLFMCDVSGHGVPAALTASMVKMSLGAWRGLIERPADTLASISGSLAGKLGGNFITACVCLIDLDSGELTFARAGHPPLLVVRADGVSEFFSPRGRLINDLMKPNYDEVRIQLFNGDKIIIYTDGITEARAGGDGLMLGEDGFAEFACANCSMSPEDLCAAAYERVASFTGSAQLEDDFTILVLEYRR